MDLRIPSGRGALLASLWAGDDEVGDGRFLDEDSAEIVPDVSPRQVVDALGLLVDGRVEYVGVNGEEGGDLDAGLDWSVTPADVESTPKRGWFRR